MTDKTATVPVWQDGDPLMEAIAAAVYEHCEVQRGTGLVIDDPRNIAAAVVATIRDAARQAAGQPAEAWPPPIQSPASTRLYDAARTKADATVGHADDCEWHTNEHSYCSCFLWPAACAGVDAMYDAAMDAAGQPDTQQQPEPGAARQALCSGLMWPEYNPRAERHGTSDKQAVQLLDAYRAEVLAEHRASFTMADARGIARQHRANVLREAADAIEADELCHKRAHREHYASLLRRMADEAAQ